MKRDWLDRPRKMVPCKFVHDGELLEEMLVPLTDADIDEANRAFPKIEGDDLVTVQAKDEGRAYFLAAVALGRESFEARDPAGLADELRSKPGAPSRAAVMSIVDAVVGHYTLTPAMLEAAKDAARPTGSVG